MNVWSNLEPEGFIDNNTPRTNRGKNNEFVNIYLLTNLFMAKRRGTFIALRTDLLLLKILF